MKTTVVKGKTVELRRWESITGYLVLSNELIADVSSVSPPSDEELTLEMSAF